MDLVQRQLLLCAVFGTVIVAIAHELRITVERLLAERKRSDDLLRKRRRTEKKLAELSRELLYRIRDIFALATSIPSQTSRYAANPVALADAQLGQHDPPGIINQTRVLAS